MAILRHVSEDSKTALRPGVDTPVPCPKPAAAKGDDDLMSSECTAPPERRRVVSEVNEVVEDRRDESLVPSLARRDLAAVLERVTKHYPHLTYLPPD